MTAMKFLSF